MSEPISLLITPLRNLKSSRPEVFCEKGVLRNFAKFTGKHLCQSHRRNFIKKETLAQVFSCESCEISKNTFFYRTPLVAASETFFNGKPLVSVNNKLKYL